MLRRIHNLYLRLGPRLVAAVVAAAASLAVVLVLLLSGSGNSSRTTSAASDRPAPGARPRAPLVTLKLKAGGSVRATNCGASHHYRTYPTGASISFRGQVRPIPSGRWKVKLKIKVCLRGAFGVLTQITASRDKHRGTFDGSLVAPSAGAYFARASLYANGTLVAKSDKRYFATS